MKQILFITTLLIGLNNPCLGLTFKLSTDSDIIGSVAHVTVKSQESLAEIGRQFDMGIFEMLEANPHVEDPWMPKVGINLLIPSQFILPNAPKDGLVLNIAEMRAYYYHSDNQYVSTYPIAVGQKGWLTPLGSGIITQKTKDPAWTVPESILQEYKAQGKPIAAVFPPGPDNPLGKYAMRLSIPGYLIHGTNRPGGIGVRSSRGCIRFLPEDIESLFYNIEVGTKVTIIHQPYKFAKYNNNIYLEAHLPLSDDYYRKQSDKSQFQEALFSKFKNLQSLFTEEQYDTWYLSKKLIEESRGFPVLFY